MNIVSMVAQYLAPVLISKLASSLGINQAIADKIVKAAVPVILAALAGKSANADGARALFDVLGKQDTGLLGRLSSVLGSPQQKTVAEQGSTTLGSLLGSTSLGSMVGAVAKFSGAAETATTGIVGMLTPIVLGTLSQQQKSAGLDAGGVAKLMSDQKANIAAAIPSDLAKLLSGSGLLDTVMPPSAAQPKTSGTEPQAPAPFNAWPWAIGVGAASLLWISSFGGPPAKWANVPAPPRLMAGNTDVAGELDGSLRSLHVLLSGVKDRSSAEAAVPQLRLAQTAIERLDGAAKQLPGENRRILAGFMVQWLPVITPLIASLTTNGTVGPVLKPVLDPVRSKLEGMAKG